MGNCGTSIITTVKQNMKDYGTPIKPKGEENRGRPRSVWSPATKGSRHPPLSWFGQR
eukprot:gene9644-3062_t